MQSRRIIGHGAYGRVELIIYPDGSKLAAKYISKERRGIDEIFEREINALSILDHENIVKLFGVGQVSNHGCLEYEIRMEYCEKGSLKSVIFNPLLVYSMKTVLTWAEQLFAALYYLSEQGIIHRDIKPENILLTESFVLKLADFGCVRDIGAINSIRITGTYRFMAPECQRSPASITPKADIFSAGLVLWEVIERKRVNLEYGSSLNHNAYFSDLRSGNFELPFVKCKHEIGVLINECTSVDPIERPKIEVIYQYALQMNQDYHHFEFMPSYHDYVPEGKIVPPIGFNSEQEITYINDESRSPRLIDSSDERLSKRTRIFHLIDSILYAPNVFNDRLDLNPQSFIDDLFGDIRNQFKSDLFEYMMKYLSIPKSYPFLIDEQPKLPKFTGFDGELVNRMIEENLTERKIKRLTLYLKIHSALLHKTFRRMHSKYCSLILDETIEHQHSLLPSFTKHPHNGKGIYANLPNHFMPLKVYTNKRTLENSWILLSLKGQVFGRFDSFLPQIIEGHFSADCHIFESKEQTLKMITVLGINEKLMIEFYEKWRNPERRRRDVQMLSKFRIDFSRGNPFPFIPYIFQLKINPSKWPYIMLSTFNEQQINEYDRFHSKVTYWLTGKDPELEVSVLEGNHYSGINYFNFLALKKTGDKILILELPQVDKKTVRCWDLSKNQIIERSFGQDQVKEDRLVKITYQKLYELRQKRDDLPITESKKIIDPKEDHPKYIPYV